MSLYIIMQKSVWGPATWKLLHCMVLNANNDIQPSQLIDLKNIILRIVSNLPCPYCTSHAINHISKSNFNNIQNINDLRVFIFQFHNKVNQQLNKKLITYEEHNDIMCKLNFKQVIIDFINIYQSKNAGVTMMLYNFHRKLMVQDMYKYFKLNSKVFNLAG
jgi:hypothetical protein